MGSNSWNYGRFCILSSMWKFSDHYDGGDSVFDSGYSCGEFSTVTTEELLKFINEFEETDDQYIKYISDNTKHETDSKVCAPVKSFN